MKKPTAKPDLSIVDRFLLASVISALEAKLRPQVKQQLSASGEGTIESQYGLVSLRDTTRSTVDTGAFIRRCRAMEIAEKRQFEALTVVKGNAPWISPDEWAKLSETSAATQLIAAPNVELVDAVKLLAAILVA